VKSVTLAGKYLITGSRDEDIRVWDLTVNMVISNYFTDIFN
jgi:WD40 repeat protein